MKEIERFGIAVVQIATIISICQAVGANRIVPAVAIPYPTGNPELKAEEEVKLRENIVNRALEALSTEIEEQTLFE